MRRIAPLVREERSYVTRTEFLIALRRACRCIYHEEYPEWDKEVCEVFGDALAFFVALRGIGISVAGCLANAGYFYPNDVIRDSDEELLEIRGIGPASLKRIRSALRGCADGEPSVSDLLDMTTGRKETPVPFPLPTKAEMRAIMQSIEGEPPPHGAAGLGGVMANNSFGDRRHSGGQAERPEPRT